MPADLSTTDSPFLRSHAQDPVRWHCWGVEALALARETGRPVLLHIGYAGSAGSEAMARESFADPDIGALLDEHFLCILVDRDELPELDRLQQLAYRLLTREDGGWPLTMFLTHDEALPFFGGGYVPPVARGGQPAFRTLLLRVAEYYRAQQAALHEQGLALRDTLARIDRGDARTSSLDRQAILATARGTLESGFDRQYGGWGTVPKFPQVLAIRHLLQHWKSGALSEQPDLQALFMATYSLARIAEGGLRDHLGGGFFRYCRDAAWQRPHFEKSLVDNAQLLEAFAEAAVFTGDALFGDVARETADALLRDFAREGGGFSVAANAASGVTPDDAYLWTPDMLRAVLGDVEAELCSARFGLDGPPNADGRWHLRVERSLESLAADPRFGPTDPGLLGARLAAAGRKLRVAREGRGTGRRARDETPLRIGPNAVATRALAIAAGWLGRDDLKAAALGTLAALRDRRPSTLEEHALLIDAILHCQPLEERAGDLAWARQLADDLCQRFEDSSRGGFFATAPDGPPLFHRLREFSDSGLPSGNARAAAVLLQLGRLTAEARYTLAAERTLRAAGARLTEQPLAHLGLIGVLAAAG